MQLGPFHFSFEINLFEVVMVCGAAWGAVRTIVRWLRVALLDRLDSHEKRLDNHQEALLNSGWLRKTPHGEIYARPAHQGRGE